MFDSVNNSRVDSIKNVVMVNSLSSSQTSGNIKSNSIQEGRGYRLLKSIQTSFVSLAGIIKFVSLAILSLGVYYGYTSLKSRKVEIISPEKTAADPAKPQIQKSPSEVAKQKRLNEQKTLVQMIAEKVRIKKGEPEQEETVEKEKPEPEVVIPAKEEPVNPQIIIKQKAIANQIAASVRQKKGMAEPEVNNEEPSAPEPLIAGTKKPTVSHKRKKAQKSIPTFKV